MPDDFKGFDAFLKPEAGYDRKEMKRAWLEQRIVGFETKAVARVLAHYDLTGYRRELLKLGADYRGRPCLTFRGGFSRLFPRFPYRLAATLVPYVHELTAWQLGKGFTQSRLFLAWEELLEELEVEGETALVFDWPKMGMWVLHNTAPHYEATGSLSIVRNVRGMVYTLEPLIQFLEGVGNAWL